MGDTVLMRIKFLRPGLWAGPAGSLTNGRIVLTNGRIVLTHLAWHALSLARAKLGTHEGTVGRFHVCVIARLDPGAAELKT